jgi:hypothetical protein
MQESLPTATFQREIMPYASGQLDIRLTLEPAENIEGKVMVQGTDQPLPGVKLLPLSSSGRGLAGIEMAEAVLSGAYGCFRMTDLLPGMVTITAVFPGEPVADWMAERNLVRVTAGETSKDETIQAYKGEVVAITVLGRKGHEPLANVSVAANRGLGVFSATAVTGADGVARVRLSSSLTRISHQ